MHGDVCFFLPCFRSVATASGLVMATLPFAFMPVQAADLTMQQARAAITPFYDGLNAGPGKDIPAILMKATSRAGYRAAVMTNAGRVTR